MEKQAHDYLINVKEVTARLCISRSGLYAGIKAGKYPAPIKLGERTSRWRASDIQKLIDNLAA